MNQIPNTPHDKVLTSQFHRDAITFYESTVQQNILRGKDYDRTREFLPFIHRWVKVKKELLSIQILGNVVSGKSTIAFYIMDYVNKKCLNKKTTMFHLCPNQITFERRVNQDNVFHNCFQVDEWNPSSETGYGATTEQTSLDTINKVMAQNFNHRVSCSPDIMNDSSVMLVLETLPKDTQNKLCHAILRYRFMYEGIWQIQTIGTVQFDVRETLNDPLYKTYIKQKHAFIRLMRKYRVKDEREFDEAELKLHIIAQYDLMAKCGIVPGKGLIEMTIDNMISSGKTRLNTSIIQKDNIAKSIKEYLDSLKSRKTLQNQITKLEKMQQKHKQANNMMPSHRINDEIKLLSDGLNQMSIQIAEHKNGLETKVRVGKQFWEDVMKENITLKLDNDRSKQDG